LGARRKDVVLATKIFMRLEPGPHRCGLSRKRIVEGCEASLRRLGTDYLDLYQAHSFDSLTPLEETLGAFDDLIRAGKVRYAGCSNYCGWQVMKAMAASRANGLNRYISQQINYSLAAREAEHELIPVGVDQGVGVMAWSPLQFGLLSGKVRRGQDAPEGSRMAALGVPGNIDYERVYQTIDVLDEIAVRRGVSVAQAALNWLIRKPRVDTVVIGARNEAQLRDNLAAATWSLSEEEMARLDAASEIPLPYPNWHQRKFAGERNPPLPSVR
jgi:aryl-alcohol dehydrogenase-like predicted oxidoreductase